MNKFCPPTYPPSLTLCESLCLDVCCHALPSAVHLLKMLQQVLVYTSQGDHESDQVALLI
jgi:hypothetical protein